MPPKPTPDLPLPPSEPEGGLSSDDGRKAALIVSVVAQVLEGLTPEVQTHAVHEVADTVVSLNCWEVYSIAEFVREPAVGDRFIKSVMNLGEAAGIKFGNGPAQRAQRIYPSGWLRSGD
jgi:hypothetical protein